MSGFGPTGGAPTGASGAGGTYLLDLADSIFCFDPSVLHAPFPLLDGVIMVDTGLWFDLPNLLDSVALGTIAINVNESFPTCVDSAQFQDAVWAAYRLTLSTAFNTATTATDYSILLSAIVDTLVATGAVSSKLEAVNAVTAALVLGDLVEQGYFKTLSDSVALADVVSNLAQLYAPLVDSVAVATTGVGYVRLVGVLSDATAASDTSSSLAEMLSSGSEEILLFGTFVLGPDEYQGWAMNTVNKAPSKYTNFPYESLAWWQQRSFMAGDGGIFEQTGDEDDGDPILAYVRTAFSDFGTGKMKRVPDLFFGFKGDGRLVLKAVSTNDNGEKVENWYLSNYDPRTGDAIREGRFELGRGIESRYWQFEIHNKAGEDLELSELALRPVILSRRR